MLLLVTELMNTNTTMLSQALYVKNFMKIIEHLSDIDHI